MDPWIKSMQDILISTEGGVYTVKLVKGKRKQGKYGSPPGQ